MSRPLPAKVSRTIHFVEPLERRQLFAFPVVQGSPFFDSASEIAVDGQGNTVVAGLFSGTADFQPGSGQTLLTSVGDTDLFVAKYSATGRLQWVKQFGGSEGDFDTSDDVNLVTRPARTGNATIGLGIDPTSLGEYVNSIAIDSSDNIYLTGAFLGRVAFGAGQAAFDTQDEEFPDIFLVKLDTLGNTTWSRQIGGRFTDVAADVALDASGNPHITGLFSRTADLDASTAVASFTALGRADVFVAKYTAAGAYVWASTMGSDTVRNNERESGNALVVLPSGDVAVTGTFAKTADFDPSPTSTFYLESEGGTDAFVARLSGTDGALVWAERTGGENFDGGVAIGTNAGGTIYTASYFEETADVDPGSGVLNFRVAEERFTDIVVSRLSASGSLIWARQLAGDRTELVGDLVVDEGGNVTLAGSFYGSADFDPSRSRAVLTSVAGDDFDDDDNDRSRDNSYDAFLWRLSATGRYQLATQLGGDRDDFAAGIAPSGTTRLLLAGRVEGAFNVLVDGASRRIRSSGRSDFFAGLFDKDLLTPIS